VVDIGDEVWVKVCDVDPEAGKMSLSMKYVSQVKETYYTGKRDLSYR